MKKRIVKIVGRGFEMNVPIDESKSSREILDNLTKASRALKTLGRRSG